METLCLSYICSFIRPHLEYAAAAWDPYLKKDIDLLELRRCPKICLKSVHQVLEPKLWKTAIQVPPCMLPYKLGISSSSCVTFSRSSTTLLFFPEAPLRSQVPSLFQQISPQRGTGANPSKSCTISSLFFLSSGIHSLRRYHLPHLYYCLNWHHLKILWCSVLFSCFVLSLCINFL